MPTFSKDKLEDICYRIFKAAGGTDDHSKTTGDHLVAANLAGHDSHGFIRVKSYIEQIETESLDPKAEPTVHNDTSTTAQVNGQGTFGQVSAKFAIELAVDKAKQSGISIITLHNAGHIGRVGTYPEIAAESGMASIVCNGWSGNVSLAGVAPFGGRAGRLGTNPISMGFPSNFEGPILLDFATSMAAVGKVAIAEARGKKLPDKWVVDKNGNPSDVPETLFDNGALLPMGGVNGGHKGYALSVMVALFGGIMAAFPTIGETRPANTQRNGGSSFMVIDVERFSPLDQFKSMVSEFIGYLKDTPPMKGSKGILYPGEMEQNNRRDRIANGIDIEDTTWAKVLSIIKKYKLEEDLAPLP